MVPKATKGECLPMPVGERDESGHFMPRSSSGMFLQLLLITATVLTAIPCTAHAQSAVNARATDRGRTMLDGAIAGGWSDDPFYPAGPQKLKWKVYVQPSISYFVANRVGLGISVGGAVGQREGFIRGGLAKTRAFEVWAGPVARLEFPFVERVSLMLLPGVYYVRSWQRVSGAGAELATDSAEERDRDEAAREQPTSFVRFTLSTPLVVHLSALTFGVGPAVWYDRVAAEAPRPDRSAAISPNLEPRTAEAETRPSMRFNVGVTSWVGASF